MQNPVPSSEVRTKLTAMLLSVYRTRLPLPILVDKKVVAFLTLDEPSGIPAMRMKASDARANWSEVLLAVSQHRAKFYFKVRFKELEEDEPAPRIYLIPSSYRNSCYIAWKAHRANYLAEQAVSSPLQQMVDELRNSVRDEMTAASEELSAQIEAGLKQLNQKIGVVFATIHRPNGDVLATPELGIVPRRTGYDLDEVLSD